MVMRDALILIVEAKAALYESCRALKSDNDMPLMSKVTVNTAANVGPGEGVNVGAGEGASVGYVGDMLGAKVGAAVGSAVADTVG